MFKMMNQKYPFQELGMEIGYIRVRHNSFWQKDEPKILPSPGADRKKFEIRIFLL
jgi:hypothetical protein